MKLIECVPNFSEGRDLTIVAAIQEAIAAVAGVTVLHATADASHNRSVITFVAPYDTAVEAAFAGIREAQTRIDLSTHAGVHPRMGAADVVPFIPLDGATMDDCVALARMLGHRVGEELGIPVYLYEYAATRDANRNLAAVRRGGFDAIRNDLERGTRSPDFGPSRIHPSAGAVAIGARPFLIAYNVYLGGAEHLPAAKDVARAVRESSGGLPAVKALGLEVDGQAQVSMNLVDLDRTSLATAFDAVVREASARNVEVTWSEIIGLIPERAAFDVAGRHLRLRDALHDHVLERKILDARLREQSLEEFLGEIGNASPTPGGGTVAAFAGALGAALIQMVTSIGAAVKRDDSDENSALRDRLTALSHEARQIADQLSHLSRRDAEVYAAVIDAYRQPRGTDLELAAREDAIREALLEAARVPLEVVRLSSRIAQMAMIALDEGKRATVPDAAVAALIADAACKGAWYNVLVNVQALDGPGTELAAEAYEVMQGTEKLTTQVRNRIAGMYPFPSK